jgi:hypothetical protein
MVVAHGTLVYWTLGLPAKGSACVWQPNYEPSDGVTPAHQSYVAGQCSFTAFRCMA